MKKYIFCKMSLRINKTDHTQQKTAPNNDRVFQKLMIN